MNWNDFEMALSRSLYLVDGMGNAPVLFLRTFKWVSLAMVWGVGYEGVVDMFTSCLFFYRLLWFDFLR